MQAWWGVGSSLRWGVRLALLQWGKGCGNWEGVARGGMCPNASSPLTPGSPMRWMGLGPGKCNLPPQMPAPQWIPIPASSRPPLLQNKTIRHLPRSIGGGVFTPVLQVEKPRPRERK